MCVVLFKFKREHGIGSDIKVESYQEIDLNRIDVLRLLLVLFSRNFYFSSSIIILQNCFAVCLISLLESQEICPFLLTVCCLSKEPVVLALLSSLLNTISNQSANFWKLP